MFKFIKLLGKTVVRLYNVEARRLHTQARKEAALAQKLAAQVQKLSDSSIQNTHGAAKVASQAQALGKFFE